MISRDKNGYYLKELDDLPVKERNFNLRDLYREINDILDWREILRECGYPEEWIMYMREIG